jgi:hypothetical protein
MEITFTRPVSYSVDLGNVKERRALAKHLNIPTRELTKLAKDGELLNEHGDGVTEWLENHTQMWDTCEEQDMEDMEVHI